MAGTIRAMFCPDDGSELLEVATGLSRCRLCQGQAVSQERFGEISPDVTALLRAEHDRESGAYGRVRACPRCGHSMRPLRMGEFPAWVESCASCDLLWVERLDGPVIERLARRTSIDRAVRSLSPGERQDMAREIAGELSQGERELAAIERMKRFLYDLRAWW